MGAKTTLLLLTVAFPIPRTLDFRFFRKPENVPTARPGMIPGKKQCVLLKGVCRDGGCTSTDDTIGECNDEKKCCRKWWIFYPYATPAPKAKSP
ncbi:beta-defensin 130B-like [Lynx rufus]|uniref:beta-defensin 130B-like n=1 Tax=Lynx rufus TaxID=61384 RepID=UPI001F1270E8|nr:beta-defensin 130B-like [Lynx rufus]